MDCDKISKNIFSYLDNELIQGERVKFESHLKECPQCEALYANLAATYEIIITESQIKASSFFYYKLQAKLERHEESKVIRIFSAILKPVAIAASITLGILIGNGEFDVLNMSIEDSETVTENFMPIRPADYSVWITLNEDNGSEN